MHTFSELIFPIIFIPGATFLISVAIWAFSTWSDLSMEETIFELNSPIGSTGGGIIGRFVRCCIIPMLIVFALCVGILPLIRHYPWYHSVRNILVFSWLGALILAGIYALFKLDLIHFLLRLCQRSHFIDEHYQDPSDTKISFPEHKKNLVYIYLESMENTYGDRQKGGVLPKSAMPELEKLAKENEDFSAGAKERDGGIVLKGTGWTMGAIFAQTCGLPLKMMYGFRQIFHLGRLIDEKHFFPDITSLGDILQQQGYQQAYLIGSDADFGYRRTFFERHGRYEILDYPRMIQDGKLPADYKVWWGYEDEKLFAFAREKVLAMARDARPVSEGGKGKPFNLTLLTVDTHFTDGYVCRNCRHEFDSRYENVIACSSRQVSAFVSWLKQQDFYKDTVIVLAGDHLTMDGRFCRKIPKGYKRLTYNCIINADKRPIQHRKRMYSTLDAFPTTLSAMGCTIEGDRLGLGTDLFSASSTLTEQYGTKKLNEEFMKTTSFYRDRCGMENRKSRNVLTNNS